MEIVGGGNVTELGREDEWLHAPDGDPDWQDSVVLCWWDQKNHVGGYHRIGIHPHHRDGARAHLTNNFFAKDCVYKRCEFIPLRSEQISRSKYDCGDGTCTFEFTDHAIWTFNQPEVSGQLHIHDYHPPIDAYPKKGQLAEQLTAGHLEVGGRISGALTLNGKKYNVEGLAFRDHGWGKRVWNVIINHRWIAATFGPELTLLAFNMQTADNTFINFGCLIRGNTITYSSNADIVVYMERDGISHRGGHVTLDLNTGEQMRFDITPLEKGVVSWMVEEMSTTDTMCEIKCGDLVGICDFEISTNPGRGSYRPRVAINAFIEDGLHKL